MSKDNIQSIHAASAAQFREQGTMAQVTDVVYGTRLGRRGLFALTGIVGGAAAAGADMYAAGRTVEAAVAKAPTVIDTTPAEVRDGKVVLKHWQNGQETGVAVPDWFQPHRSLRSQSDIQPGALDLSNLQKFDDFEYALNTRRPEGPLAGYSYDYNDFSRAVDPDSTEQLQAMMLGWTQLGGRRMTLPGIGHIEGAHRIPVVMILMNRASNVHKWDAEHPVTVESGFMSAGRLWDANDNDKLTQFEAAMIRHKLARQFYGTGDGKFEGVGDHPDNAVAARVVTVQRRNNAGENTFQFVRAQEFKRP